MNRGKYFVAVLCPALAFLLVTGCSVTGWATKEPPKGLRLNEGETVTVLQKDGRQSTGEYVGLGAAPFADYVAEYELLSQESIQGKYLPAIGQDIEVSTSLSDTKVWQGQFLGFDHRSLWMRTKGELLPHTIYFSSITGLSGRDGKMLSRSTLRSMFLSGEIPLMSAVEIRGPGETILIPFSNIKDILVGNATGTQAADHAAMGGSDYLRSFLR